jgi:hypothetical protein
MMTMCYSNESRVCLLGLSDFIPSSSWAVPSVFIFNPQFSGVVRTQASRMFLHTGLKACGCAIDEVYVDYAAEWRKLPYVGFLQFAWATVETA